MKLGEFIKIYYDVEDIDFNVISILYLESGMSSLGKFKKIVSFETYINNRIEYDVYYSNVIQDNLGKGILEFTINLGLEKFYLSMDNKDEFIKKLLSRGLKKHRSYQKKNIPSMWNWEGIDYLFTSKKYE